MKEKFEHKITNRINEVFGAHQVDYNLQDWENLKAQLPANKSRLAALIWTISKVAAVVLLALAGTYLFWEREPMYEADIGENDIQTPVVNSFGITYADTTINLMSENPPGIENILPNESEELNIQENIQNKNSTPEPQVIPEVPPEDDKYKRVSDYAEIQKPRDTIVSEEEITEPVEITSVVQNDIIIPDINNKMNLPPLVLPMTESKKNKLRFGVEIASFANFSQENITSSMNYGGGIASNIPIRKRFSFNPGLVFSVYNMQLEDNQSFITQTEFEVLNTSGVQNISSIKPSEVQLTALDVPINFQYQFLERKNGSYFMELGFSSLFYLSENYSYELIYIDNSGCPPGTSCSTTNTVTEESSLPAFKTFDFAKFLNFSVGFDYHLSKRFDMVVNPYLKYPVNSLSGTDLKFGSGGLKLKFMIVPKK